MEKISKLSPAHCVLLAVHYASEANVRSLHTLTSLRHDVLHAELILRIVLTYIPENVNPPEYTGLIQAVVDGIPLKEEDWVDVDVTRVNNISERDARKRVRKLHLLPLVRPARPEDASLDLVTCFLIHRVTKIEAETGLLTLAPRLVEPFLEKSDTLRTWFISVLLPLLRWSYEFYPDGKPPPTVEAFETMVGTQAVDTLLRNALDGGREDVDSRQHLSRDLKGLVGPWVYGSSDRKRRRLSRNRRRSSVAAVMEDPPEATAAGSTTKDPVNEHQDWELVFSWMVRNAATRFQLISSGFQHWGGPDDVDLGGYGDDARQKPHEGDEKLRSKYSQAIFASIYATETDNIDTMESAHQLLGRIAQLMRYDPPRELSISSHPRNISYQNLELLQAVSNSAFDTDALLHDDNPVTKSTLESFALLSNILHSAYIFSAYSHRISIKKTARLRFASNRDEQFTLLKRIIHNVITGKRRDDKGWELIRSNLLWLLDWDAAAAQGSEGQFGNGVFTKLKRTELEREILDALLSTGTYSLATRIYAGGRDQNGPLSADEVQKVVLDSVLRHYDNASNGNRTRGSMKKASDILSAFRPYYRASATFRSCEALISATHALSFYSLTLQHGVPFQPVNVRVSTDPLTLIAKVLEQNPRSYTKLDDLIEIGKNLVMAGLAEQSEGDSAQQQTEEELDRRKRTAERRIIGLAIEAALAEEDFETAYSYVMNRLHPISGSSSPVGPDMGSDNSAPPALVTSHSEDEDDVSWRAAFNAGRHKSSSLSSSHASVSSSTPLHLRRLEQRMELLSQALLLAPPSALPEVLIIWRRCEEEMTTLLEREAEEEERFKDRADRKVPGGFEYGPAPQPVRREIGRGAVEEAPMGLFDIARGAAAALSKSAFPLKQAAQASTPLGQPGHARTGSAAGSEAGSDGEGRVRRRDIVANAVTEGLASGLGWVLGAKPVQSS